jgi:hypothetical protein
MITFPSLPLHRLTHLDLSHNLLNSIPASLASLHSLQSLNLSNNLIVSVRNAPSVLGNITTLNISKNRIDCLVGLERLLGLERVDVRSNELYEVGEVGRLAVLPHIREVWCASNPFDQVGSEWRTDLGISFASEGRQVMVDDRPWTWQEKRTIDAALAAKGRLQSHSRQPSSASARQGRAESHQHQQRPEQRHAESASSKPNPHNTHMSPPSIAPSQASTPTSSHAVQKKRRPRRVITLDEDVQEEPTQTQDERIGGSLRLPAKSERGKGGDERKVGTASFTVPEKTQQRSSIMPDTFQPPTPRDRK